VVHRERSFSLLPVVKSLNLAPHRLVGATVTPDEMKTFDDRAKPFFVEWERGRQIPISFYGRVTRKLGECTPAAGRASEISNGLGLFRGCLRVPAAELGDRKNIRFNAVSETAAGPAASGVIHLIPESGVSVISDIDDTIKHSDVLNRKELILNTFYRDLEAVPRPTGSEAARAARLTMATVYTTWVTTWDARVHYVSGSPWQLYTLLDTFIHANDFPEGTFHLRPLRFKDPTIFLRFALRSPKSHKLETIRSIIDRFPKRCYVLVGDSGESDPEVYRQIAQAYPTQVSHIYIRTLSGDRRTYPLFERVIPFKVEPGVTSDLEALSKAPRPTCTRGD
jgi:hypothetical protein